MARSLVWMAAVALAAPAGAAAQAAPARTVQVQMRNVAFHVDTTIVLNLHYVRGELRRTDSEHAPFLDDKHSFTLGIDSARIGIMARIRMDRNKQIGLLLISNGRPRFERNEGVVAASEYDLSS